MIARPPRIVLAAGGMAAGLSGAMFLFGEVFARDLDLRIAALALLIAFGIALYFGLAALLGATRLSDLKELLARRRRTPRVPGPDRS